MALSPKKKAALDALLTGGTIKAAAEVARTTEQTLHRWMAEDEFASELREAQTRALFRAVGLLKQRAVDAVQRLTLEMDADDPSTARIQAADKLLNHALRLGDAVEMRARVMQLEEALKLRELDRPGPETVGEGGGPPGP